MSAQVMTDVQSTQRKMPDNSTYNDDPSGVMQDVGGRMRDMVQKGKAKATQMEEGFEHYVQAKPIQSVLIAAGAGLLIGYLFGKRR